MPRRNENARPRELMAHGRWSLAELKAMNEHLDRKEVLRQAQDGSRQNAVIKTTGEQIVRDFRRSKGVLPYAPTYEIARSMRPLFRPPHRTFFLKRWFRAVDWKNIFDWNGKAFDYACWTVLIACAIYLGIVVFAPFTAKLLR